VSGSAATLVAHQALLSLISFGGTPGVLPDLRDFVVARGWMSSREFADCFAVIQAIPGPNMILLMSFVAWKVGGVPTAVAGGLASFVPSCTLAFTTFRFWERFRDTAWQQRVRRGLAPVVIGLIVAGGYVMARSTPGLATAALTLTAAVLVTCTRLNPLWFIAAGGALGACGLV
jgi:chromate transporter